MPRRIRYDRRGMSGTSAAPRPKETKPSMGVVRRSIVLALGMAIGGAARAAEALPGAQEAADRAIRELKLQTEIPGMPPPSAPWSIDLPDGFAWALVVLGIAFLLYLVKDYIPFLRGRGAGEWGGLEDGDGQGLDHLPHHLAIAEALAAENRFVEAMHELLLEALGAIRARLGERLADSLTSREILYKAPLPERGRGALREIIGRVEWTYFGEHPAQRADYLACRDSFDRLSEALQSAPAA
jgi:hypothetical protein